MFIICPSCSHRNDDSAAFCESCGQSLAEQRKNADVDKNLMEIAQEQPSGYIEMEQCIAWFNEALDLLITLHSQKPPLIHGNIRPENIKLNKNGKLYLSGFVGQFEQEEDSTGHKPDEATDIFCLGATFHFLFSGQYPHEPGTRELFLPLSKVMSQYVPDFPYEIQEMLDRMLHPNRDLRYKSAQEVKSELGDYLEKHLQKHTRRGISFSDQPTSGKLNGISRVTPRAGRSGSTPAGGMPITEALPATPQPGTEKLSPVKTTLAEPKQGPWDRFILFLERLQEKPWLKIAIGIGLIFVFILWVSGLITPHWKFFSAMNRGERLMREGKFDLSVKAYRHALEINPQKEEKVFEQISKVYTARGMKHVHEENFELAQVQFTMIKKLGAGYPKIRKKFSRQLNSYSRKFMENGKLTRALTLAESSIVLEPDRPDNRKIYDQIRQSIFRRGIAQYNKENYADAISDFNILLQGHRSQGYQKIYYWRGCAYIKQNHYLDGLDDLHQVKTLMAQEKLKLSVEDIAAMNGFFRYANSQLKSEHLARGARELARKGMKAYEKLQYKEAVKYFGKFLRLMRREPKVKAKLGDYYEKNIDEIKARMAGSYYNLALGLSQNNEITRDGDKEIHKYCRLSRYYDPSEANKKRCQEMIDKAGKLFSISKLAQEARDEYNLGRENFNNGEPAKALPHLKRFLKLIDDHPKKVEVRKLLEPSILSKIANVRKEFAEACYKSAQEMKGSAPGNPGIIKKMEKLSEQSTDHDPSPENKQRWQKLMVSVGAEKTLPKPSPSDSPKPPPLP